MAAGEINFGLLDPNAPGKIATSFIQGQQLGQQYRAQELQNQAAEAQYQNMLAKQEAYKAAGGDYNKLAQELTNRGLAEDALKIKKDIREEKKLGFEMDLKNQELFSKTLERVAANPTDAELGAYLNKGVASGWFTQNQAAKAASEMQGLNLEQRMKKLAPQALGMKDYLSYQNQVRQTDISAGNLAETRRAHDLQYGENVVANTVTDNAGNVTQFNRYGQVIGTPGKVGKPSAQFEKTENLQKQQKRDLDLAIGELDKATKDGGLIDQSTGSGIGRATDVTAGFFGKSTPGALAIGKLKPIADLALKMVPRFEGPQSDKDTQSYKEAAGQLADPTLPTDIRKAAGREVLRLMKQRKNQFVSEGMANEGIGPGGGNVAPPSGFQLDK